MRVRGVGGSVRASTGRTSGGGEGFFSGAAPPGASSRRENRAGARAPARTRANGASSRTREIRAVPRASRRARAAIGDANVDDVTPTSPRAERSGPIVRAERHAPRGARATVALVADRTAPKRRVGVPTEAMAAMARNSTCDASGVWSASRRGRRAVTFPPPLAGASSDSEPLVALGQSTSRNLRIRFERDGMILSAPRANETRNVKIP